MRDWPGGEGLADLSTNQTLTMYVILPPRVYPNGQCFSIDVHGWGIFDEHNPIFRYLDLNLKVLYLISKLLIPLDCTQRADHLQSGSPPQDKAGQTQKMGHTLQSVCYTASQPVLHCVIVSVLHCVIQCYTVSQCYSHSQCYTASQSVLHCVIVSVLHCVSQCYSQCVTLRHSQCYTASQCVKLHHTLCHCIVVSVLNCIIVLHCVQSLLHCIIVSVLNSIISVTMCPSQCYTASLCLHWKVYGITILKDYSVSAPVISAQLEVNTGKEDGVQCKCCGSKNSHRYQKQYCNKLLLSRSYCNNKWSYSMYQTCIDSQSFSTQSIASSCGWERYEIHTPGCVCDYIMATSLTHVITS